MSRLQNIAPRSRPKIDKAGQGRRLTVLKKWPKALLRLTSEAYSEYEGYLAADMRRELARVNLPVSLYTEWYWKIDLHNLLHFLQLRLDAHAQYEIRVFAEAMAGIVKEKVPLAWKAFEDYALESVRFTKLELEVLRKALKGEPIKLSEHIKNKRERGECLEKIKSLGYEDISVE